MDAMESIIKKSGLEPAFYIIKKQESWQLLYHSF